MTLAQAVTVLLVASAALAVVIGRLSHGCGLVGSWWRSDAVRQPARRRRRTAARTSRSVSPQRTARRRTSHRR